jgi:hypothetical protein
MLKWGWDYNRDLRDDQPLSKKELQRLSNTISISDNIDDGINLPDPITFKVQAVSGGTLVETRWYDYKKDDQIVKLHIITQEENLAESIGKIVTMELLQK